MLVHRLRGKDMVAEDFIREAESATRDVDIRNTAVYVTSKFNRFVSDMAMRNLICQNRSIDLKEVVNERKILLVNLGRGRFGEHSARLLASMMVSRLRHAVMGRGFPNPPFFLYADECQLFADGRLAELLAEARKFGLAITLAHQYMDQLPQQVLGAILGNVATTVAFRVSSSDAHRIAELFAPELSPRDFVRMPNFHAAIRSGGSLGLDPFMVNTLSPSAPINPKRGALIREISRLRFGRDCREVEREIRATYDHYMQFKTT